MSKIETVEQLRALYPAAKGLAVDKQLTRLDPHCRKFISLSPFLVLSTKGQDGLIDISPRGGDPGFIHVEDDETLLLPDWRGNNRLDSLRNIVRDGRVSLMFMNPGCTNVVRVNGRAVLTDDADLRARFETARQTPRTVIVTTVKEVYFQCAKALMRSGLWAGEDLSTAVPTAGEFIREFTEGFDAKAYDEGYDDYAKARMW